MNPTLFNTRKLRHDEEGFKRYTSWMYGGWRDKCSPSDVDFECLAGDSIMYEGSVEVHDGKSSPERLLRMEFKPHVADLSIGQERTLKFYAKYDDITQLVVSIPAVESELGRRNPNYICHPDSLVEWAEVDKHVNWRKYIVRTTLWEFNQRMRHYHREGVFVDSLSNCTCEGCSWGTEEYNEVLRRHKLSLKKEKAGTTYYQ